MRMDNNISAIERAFQLAATGQFTSVAKLRLQLSAEGFLTWQVEGRELAKRLKVAIITSRKLSSATEPRA
jgi:hypothetical protein